MTPHDPRSYLSLATWSWQCSSRVACSAIGGAAAAALTDPEPLELSHIGSGQSSGTGLPQAQP